MAVNTSTRFQRRAGDNVGRLLLRAARAFETELNQRLQRRGYGDVRLAHSAVFAHIDLDGTRIVDLAERAGMTKQSMGELVNDLIAKGYLERQPDPSDGRARLVRPSERGRQHIRDAQTEIAALEAAYRRLLGSAELTAMRSALEQLASRGVGAGKGGEHDGDAGSNSRRAR